MNPKTKIFYMGRRINGQFDSFKMKAKRFFSSLFHWTLVGGMAYLIFMAGAFFYSTNTTEAVVKIVMIDSPVLERIADCESGNGTKGSASHYEGGQVLMRANKNGTIDIGKYQVNEHYWGAKATALGLDLTKEADNKKMAEWIYANKGTTDWSASQKCWYK